MKNNLKPILDDRRKSEVERLEKERIAQAYAMVKKDMLVAFEQVGLTEKDQLWNTHEFESDESFNKAEEAPTVFMTKD